MTAQDANNFDSNLTWNVTITKPGGMNSPPGGTGYDAPSLGAAAGIVFPAKNTDPGYVVTITASDSSAGALATDRRSYGRIAAPFAEPLATAISVHKIRKIEKTKRHPPGASIFFLYSLRVMALGEGGFFLSFCRLLARAFCFAFILARSRE